MMSEDSTTSLFRRLNWNSSVPLQIKLLDDSSDVIDTTFISPSRFSYPSLIYQQLKIDLKLRDDDNFAFQVELDDGSLHSLKLHWSIGLSYDYFTFNFISNTNMPPLRLILQQNTQSPNTYAANILDSTKMSFMASLKESQLVRWGTVKRMTSLKRSETEQLWSSLEKNLFDDYFKVANKLLPNNTEETPRAVPIKLVLPDSIVIQDILPYHYSLLEYLQHALPLLFPKNQSKYQNLGYPVLHGTIIPLESIIGWLDGTLSSADGFLRICIIAF
ncbi:hypothetical protein WALSEDRAFT_34917 [Wallemia mellicola CBS 633.66]|uniref:Autophagy protein 5 n=1 Tax=Wallemia mellicola (strain ATCC MYA-4683 / CBS 633.66) TaxID=671144 RepID=I4YJX5_WALMC|nr:hypothetical protein WALSEDRAFT_34917 [Wallemia mellicola CBS 633.66]EIM24267.1 hypothetical protein WALSEDRAFT_34917 [Wallemia mellicola CBS 633.66]|eukprot:XP_006956083.1 hypothetical protein WALSEDRAFT_34917 [Wallemia mellicola CBS 633.66]